LGKTVLVTGGAGFIGSNFVLRQIAAGDRVINLDKLTYAGNFGNLVEIHSRPEHTFVNGGIEDAELVTELLEQHRPDYVVNFAAESHVDRSILGPEAFIQTNVIGTFRLLDTCLKYWRTLSGGAQQRFRFLQISTDEVYGSLGPEDPAFCESTQYAPNSPYSASKASSDHLARAYFHTYGLPVLTTNCSNNYGPYQFPEKLIPLMILNALDSKPLPVYGDGLNVRDWLYVGDHCEALSLVLKSGKPGETYNIGGESEMTNMQVVKAICAILDEFRPAERPHETLIQYVKDRPGHDRRYAVNCTKMKSELGWAQQETFMSGIRKTVQWYLDHQDWIREVASGAYRNWIDTNYGDRNLACEA
jgi:dTDP-glucose 4,6-dehydratase